MGKKGCLKPSGHFTEIARPISVYLRKLYLIHGMSIEKLLNGVTFPNHHWEFGK